MIKFTTGNLLEDRSEALVNTVNTVGIMGKGIALMFKERFPENFRRYVAACKATEVRVGEVFATPTSELNGPLWIVNFPTKQHWRGNSRVEWIVEGLKDLRCFIEREGIKSIAIPPLGAGNGGLTWPLVRSAIETAFEGLEGVAITVYEPTREYQNVAKRVGVEKLTPARGLIGELIRRYLVLGMECSLIEVQKLAWFLERAIERAGSENPLKLDFKANRYGPYANRLTHLLESLDGSYLHCEKRISDAQPLDVVWFDEGRKNFLQTYLKSAEVRPYIGALKETIDLIEGFESPFGMELLATVDWLVTKEGASPTVQGIRQALSTWPGGDAAAKRKLVLFDEDVIAAALTRLAMRPASADSSTTQH